MGRFISVEGRGFESGKYDEARVVITDAMRRRARVRRVSHLRRSGFSCGEVSQAFRPGLSCFRAYGARGLVAASSRPSGVG